jgi:hypothetical protein
VDESNPYRSPCENWEGKCDWSLWRAFVRAVAPICLLLLFVDAVALLRYVKIVNHEQSIVTVVSGFFADWKAGSMPIERKV